MIDPPSTPQTPKRILIVDDEKVILKVVADWMEDAGHEVGVASDGPEGLRMFRGAAWDLVITDRAMPGMDGVEMAKAIKAAAPDVPIILITGMPQTVQGGGVLDAVLPKPFRQRDILRLVAAHLLA